MPGTVAAPFSLMSRVDRLPSLDRQVDVYGREVRGADPAPAALTGGDRRPGSAERLEHRLARGPMRADDEIARLCQKTGTAWACLRQSPMSSGQAGAPRAVGTTGARMDSRATAWMVPNGRPERPRKHQAPDGVIGWKLADVCGLMEQRWKPGNEILWGARLSVERVRPVSICRRSGNRELVVTPPRPESRWPDDTQGRGRPIHR